VAAKKRELALSGDPKSDFSTSRMAMRWLVFDVLCAAYVSTLMGSSSVPAAPNTALAIAAGVSYPSSAAFDPIANTLIVGSYSDGSIRRVPLASTTSHAALSPLPQDGRRQVIRIRIDASRGRIWVLGSEALYLYDGSTSKLIGRIPIEELSQHSKEHCLPDLGIDRGGNVFVSSAMQPKLVRIDAKTLGVTSHALELDADKGKDFGFSAIAFGADGASLYGASATMGTLWKIDVTKGTGEKVSLEHPVWGACAMHVTRPDAFGSADSNVVLFVASGFRGGVQRVELSRRGLPHRITRVRMTAPVSVPTDVVAIRSKLLIVSSRLSDHPDFDGEGRPGLSFTIVQSY
jgi:sugar lactone lactonase YvrE